MDGQTGGRTRPNLLPCWLIRPAINWLHAGSVCALSVCNLCYFGLQVSISNCKKSISSPWIRQDLGCGVLLSYFFHCQAQTKNFEFNSFAAAFKVHLLRGHPCWISFRSTRGILSTTISSYCASLDFSDLWLRLNESRPRAQLFAIPE